MVSASAPPALASSAQEAALNPFARNYLTFELARNDPMTFTQNRFDSGPVHPVFGYWHALSRHWLMGLSGQFKIFQFKGQKEIDKGDIALWTVTHSAMHVSRLHHPYYLLAGPKLMFLLPAQAGTLPLQKDPDYETEVGAGVSVGLLRLFTERVYVTARVDRWRGTRTSRFQGLETAVGIGYALD